MKKEDEIKKYLEQKNAAQFQWEKLQGYTNAAGTALFESKACETRQVNIVPDDKVPRAKFIPDLLDPKKFRAHPVTIRAMRKDLFLGGEDFVDLECLIACPSCRASLDLQFWHFCPYCESAFSKSPA